jgi:ankyrin repeat protein
MISMQIGWTPLLVAARDVRLHVIRQLLLKGARIDMMDKHSWTVLHRTAEWGKVKVVYALI